VNQPGEHLAITCACVTTRIRRTTRGSCVYAVDVPNEEQNLCMKCHHKRGTPDLASQQRAALAGGPVLLGYGGWWPPNMQFPGTDTATIAATHGSVANPRLCAGCHVNAFTTTDQMTGERSSTGHTFAALPCT
jgi:hypothetical protein